MVDIGTLPKDIRSERPCMHSVSLEEQHRRVLSYSPTVLVLPSQSSRTTARLDTRSDNLQLLWMALPTRIEMEERN